MWNWQDMDVEPKPLTFRDDYLMATGLGGETGEVLEVLKKYVRSHLDTPDKLELLLELGDVMYYLTMIAERYGLNLNEILEANVNKLESRKATRLAEKITSTVIC